jgi:uncharacterized protein YcfL
MKVLRFFSVSLIVAVLAGCSASNVATPEQDEKGSYQTVLKSNNSTLSSRIDVVDLKQRLTGDLLQVQATLENEWKFELDFQYKLKWFDANDFEVAPESQSWRQLVMPGRGQQNVQGIAPNPSVTRFEIWVRE